MCVCSQACVHMRVERVEGEGQGGAETSSRLTPYIWICSRYRNCMNVSLQPWHSFKLKFTQKFVYKTHQGGAALGEPKGGRGSKEAPRTLSKVIP